MTARSEPAAPGVTETDPLPGQLPLFGLAALAPARRTPGRQKLTAAGAARLYRSGMSACEIARDYKLTRSGVEARIRAGGLAGVRWCPVHRTCEELHPDFRAAPPAPAHGQRMADEAGVDR